MAYKTYNPSEILVNPHLRLNSDLSYHMVSAVGTIDLYNNSTWNGIGVVYGPLFNIVHMLVSIHTIHQQHYKNHIQIVQMVTLRLIGKDRQTLRAIVLYHLLHSFIPKTKEAKENRR